MNERPLFAVLTFRRERKLRRRADFLRVQGARRRVVSAHFYFLVEASPLGPEAPSRLGLVLTKKIGNAVARNRVKRLCRECFRRSPELLPSGVDLVVIARSGAPALTLGAVEAEWREAQALLWKRAKGALAEVKAPPS